MTRPIALILASLLATSAAPPPEPVYDIVIRGGRMLDGAGNPRVTADVAIRDGRIAGIGVIEGKGKQEIDARGRYVSPGFIDMLDRSGRTLLRDGSSASKLRMGVTTLVAGEGGTAVPADEIAGCFSTLEKQGIAVNFGTYYGTIQVRMKVMGDGAGAPGEAQLRAMEGEVRTAMRGGAFGISSALIYSPASFQTATTLPGSRRSRANAAASTPPIWGMRADLVVFDLATIKDRATIVNGVVALAHGQPTGSRSGAVLRHSCPDI